MEVSSIPTKIMECSSLGDALPAISMLAEGKREEAGEGENERDGLDTARAKKTARNKKKKENARRNREAKGKTTQSNVKILPVDMKEGYRYILKVISTNRNYNSGALEDNVLPQTEYNPSTSSLFEIKPTNRKGLGLFSLDNFTRGDILFREDTLLPASAGWSMLCNEASFVLASDEKKARYKALYSRCCCNKIPCYETDFGKIYNSNGVRLQKSTSTSLENEKCIGPVYELASRINHSCQPNAFLEVSDRYNHITVTAIRPIEKGEEVTIDVWGSSNLDTDKEGRQLFLAVFANFNCHCDACVDDIPVDAYSNEALLTNLKINDSKAQILGLNTPAERAAALSIENWAIDLVTKFPGYQKVIEEALQGNTDDIVPKKRALFVVNYVLQILMDSIYHEENRFALGTEVFEKFMSQAHGHLMGEYHACTELSTEELVGDVFKKFADILLGC